MRVINIVDIKIFSFNKILLLCNVRCVRCTEYFYNPFIKKKFFGLSEFSIRIRKVHRTHRTHRTLPLIGVKMSANSVRSSVRSSVRCTK